MREKVAGSFWWDRDTPLCYSRSAENKELGSPMCVFPTKPKFRRATINNHKCGSKLSQIKALYPFYAFFALLIWLGLSTIYNVVHVDNVDQIIVRLLFLVTPSQMFMVVQSLFSLRGLCKESAMDTQYKFAAHVTGKIYLDSDSRSFVGPKGWRISRSRSDRKWRISHYHYTHLTLTMVDMDILPVGKHKWMIENNVCNEGVTNFQELQLSGCNEEQFTCDDGKCINISQRCDNIEVRKNQETLKTS